MMSISCCNLSVSVNKSVQKFDFRVAIKADSTIKELHGAARASDVGTNGICYDPSLCLFCGGWTGRTLNRHK